MTEYWLPLFKEFCGIFFKLIRMLYVNYLSCVGKTATFWFAGLLLGICRLEATKETVLLETSTGALFGTIELPQGYPGYPVVLIIPGSGPTDRDGNSGLVAGKNDGLKQFAETLSRRGIASLRIDKRGVGSSAGALASETDLRFDDFVDDAIGWIELLRMDGRFSSVSVAGHSQGALVGMLAVIEAGADAYISIAGPGRKAGDLLREQLLPQLDATLFDQADAILTELEEGRLVPNPPPELATLFRENVQPFFVSWLRFDPSLEIRKLEIPVLLVQGDSDLQVVVSDFERLSDAAPEADTDLIPGMNHVLKQTGLDMSLQLQSFVDPSVPLADQLPQTVARFLGQRIGTRVKIHRVDRDHLELSWYPVNGATSVLMSSSDLVDWKEAGRFTWSSSIVKTTVSAGSRQQFFRTLFLKP